MSRKAVFEGLVMDQAGRPLTVTRVGVEAQYVIDDDGFLRHIDAELVDRQVIEAIQAQVNANKDMVEESIMKMVGSDDLFTKATLDASIKNMDRALDQGIPDDARQWLGMMGFRVVVNLHGEVAEFKWPGALDERDE